MATPVAPTPILSGEDARRFRKDMLTHFTRQLSPEEQEKKRLENERRERNFHFLDSLFHKYAKTSI